MCLDYFLQGMIYNSLKKTAIAKEYKVASSLKDKTFGLLIKKNPRAMLFKTRFGIHTFFMKEAIDVVVLNNKNYVSAVKKELVPNKIYFWNPKFNTILELPFGSLERSKTEVGDRISFS
ncbi:MAG: hypothetical protein COX79_02850 [Candidatus Levybacteria bacterium CG_4_10_14_0_2_um_filter_36_16]|nr:MAG: hypothetical protein AUK12_01070 [Candidatus Levybacteria bacterium CG2_30_37_29]PIR78954.1 MAG: hypothetical protein COU26_03720 [Candidatus Levybacteria bacterium CG10_big_fil_rev_8_21_14_0_10_36_30]PIZ97263.1 MAG: hypothetical protein COX79_02850 [Candidatus Levybacteria bacterium CG_4_10_14_0_2_um_filter_36_16]